MSNGAKTDRFAWTGGKEKYCPSQDEMDAAPVNVKDKGFPQKSAEVILEPISFPIIDSALFRLRVELS